MAETPNYVRKNIVTLGLRRLKGGKLGAALEYLDKVADPETRVHLYERGADTRRFEKPGLVWNVATTEDRGSIVFGGGPNAPAYVGKYTDDLDILFNIEDEAARRARQAEWEARHESEIVADRMRKKLAEAGKEREFRNLLAPIKKAYAETDYYGRLAIEALVVAELRRL
jgi:hypothetical protein